MTTDQLTGKRLSIGAKSLLDLLEGAIIATGKDETLPTLTGIYLESFSTETDEGGLSATATDRYRLITGKSHWKGEPFKALLQNKDAAKVIKELKPIAKRNDPRAIVISVTDYEITFTLPEVSFTFRKLDGTFPPYEHLLVKAPKETDQIALNPSFLGDFAKMPPLKDKQPMRLTFQGSNKPVIIGFGEASPNEIQWRALLMPMRVSS